MNAERLEVRADLPSFERCRKAAAERLSGRRFLHVLGVCHAAATLAAMRGLDPASAAIAGLLHDIAKETPPETLKSDLESRGRPLDPEDMEFPSLWHAAAGALWAEQDFGVSDAAVLEAIRLHPTLDAGAGPLAEIVYLADYTEPTRKWQGVEDLRRRARVDFPAALADAVERKYAVVSARRGKTHPRARRALEHYGRTILSEGGRANSHSE